MPSNAFNRDVLKIAVAQICHSLGWNSLQKSSLVVLTDILERYMKKLSKATGWFCQNCKCFTELLADLLWNLFVIDYAPGYREFCNVASISLQKTWY